MKCLRGLGLGQADALPGFCARRHQATRAYNRGLGGSPWVYGQWSLSLEAGNILKFQQKIFSRIYYIFRLFLTAFSVAPTPPKLVDSQSAELCYDSHTLLHLLILKLLILSSSEMKFSAMSALVHRRGTHANAP